MDKSEKLIALAGLGLAAFWFLTKRAAPAQRANIYTPPSAYGVANGVTANTVAPTVQPYFDLGANISSLVRFFRGPTAAAAPVSGGGGYGDQDALRTLGGSPLYNRLPDDAVLSNPPGNTDPYAWAESQINGFV